MSETTERPCTCHPSEAPVPCQHKYAYSECVAAANQTTNIIYMNMTDGRREVWTFPDGTTVTMEVPADEPPITVKHAVYCLSSILHQTHTAVFS